MWKWSITLALCAGIVLSVRMAWGQATEVPAPTERTVFVILMENHNWSQIKDNPSAPYINALLAQGAHAEAILQSAAPAPQRAELHLAGSRNEFRRDQRPRPRA